MESTSESTLVSLTINGQKFEQTVPNRRLLVDFLGMTGTKEACSVGVCGACTVLLNGKMVASCLTLAVQANGGEVTTVEGIADGENLHPVQEAFINYGGFQCGACTPGQIVAAKSLLDSNPHPSEEEIKDWMMGNLCRCTGYYQIIESIQAAASGKQAG